MYDRSPAITPEFDFAELYDANLGSASAAELVGGTARAGAGKAARPQVINSKEDG